MAGRKYVFASSPPPQLDDGVTCACAIPPTLLLTSFEPSDSIEERNDTDSSVFYLDLLRKLRGRNITDTQLEVHASSLH
jgi:hypothetical protein